MEPNAGNEPYSGDYYGQGYGCGGHDGQGGYGGCAYDSGYGYYNDDYNGYYGQGGNCGTGDCLGVSFDHNNTTEGPSSSNAVPGRVNAGSEGGELSWLSNAANTVNTLAEREEKEDGGEVTSNTQQQQQQEEEQEQQSKAGGTGPGATRLPPIEDAASVPPWMAIS